MEYNILTFIDYYLPGFKGGGPITSVSYLISRIDGQLNFKIVTRNNDLGDDTPYNNLVPNKWLQEVGFESLYLSGWIRDFFTISNILKNNRKCPIFLNSFFSAKFSIYPFVLSKLLRAHSQVIVAPRGEFHAGALNIKKLKKSLFIFVIKIMRVYKNVIWLASTDIEKNTIQKYFKDAHVEVIGEPPPVIQYSLQHVKKKKGFLSVVYISRITTKKNLIDAIKIIKKADGNIKFDIYGPVADKRYFHKCMKLAKCVSDAVKISYCGELKYHQVMPTLAKYDLFFLPTHGENYGYVILESLSASTPVLISDQTPWQDLKNFGAGFDISLSCEEDFVRTLNTWVDLDEPAHAKYRKAALAYAKAINDKDTSVNQYIELFNRYK